MPNLTGYGPHSITTNGDYDVKAVNNNDGRPQLLTLSFDFGTYDGNVTIKSRKKGSTADFETQSYVKADGSVVSTALSVTDVTVQIDATGKDIRLVTAGRSTGTLSVEANVATES